MAASFGSGVDIGEVAFKFTADAWGFGADETTSPYRFTARRVDEARAADVRSVARSVKPVTIITATVITTLTVAVL